MSRLWREIHICPKDKSKTVPDYISGIYRLGNGYCRRLEWARLATSSHLEQYYFVVLCGLCSFEDKLRATL